MKRLLLFLLCCILFSRLILVTGEEPIDMGITTQISYTIDESDDPEKWRHSEITAASSNTHADFTHESTNGVTIRKGVDVSSHQETIDWKKVSSSGVEFAIIRGAYRGYGSAGTLKKDKYFDKNISGAKEAGLKVGVYIFSQALTIAEAKEEANFLLDIVKRYQIDLPLVIDFEYVYDDNGKLIGRLTPSIGKRTSTDICNEFCGLVEKAGYSSMVYANKSTLTNNLYASEFEHVWLAQYNSRVTYTGNYEYWQCSETGAVNGISGKVDLDFWYDPVRPIVPNITSTKGIDTSSIEVKWDKVSGASKYMIMKREKGAGEGNYDDPVSCTTTSYTFKGLKAGKQYLFRICSVVGGKFSSYCKAVYGCTLCETPEITSASALSSSSIKITWNESTHADKYIISRKISDGGIASYDTIATVDKTTTTYTDKNLKAGTLYKYSVLAVNQLGEISTFENEKTVKQLTKNFVLTMRFNCNGGTVSNTEGGFASSNTGIIKRNGNDVTSVAEYGDTIALSQYGLWNASSFGLERMGYSFVGWSLSKDGSTTVFDQDDTTLRGEIIYPNLKNGDAQVVLYAIWIPCKYTFNYSSNGASGSMQDTIVEYGKDFTVSACGFVKYGYKFNGWNAQRNDGTWYVANKGWLSDEAIETNNYEKKLYVEGSILNLGNSWLSGADSKKTISYTFYALWEKIEVAYDFILPMGLTEIEDEAFYGLKMTSVKCPDTIISIGNKAFADCKNLEKIYIPVSVKIIAQDAFEGAKNDLIIICKKDSKAYEFAVNYDYDYLLE